MPVHGRFGFPFHDACWSLLEQAYSSEPSPLRRLFDVCRSLPFSIRMDCVTWDHDFGGLISMDDDSYPWEDLFVDREVAFASSDPYLVPEIQQLPCETPTSPNAFKTVSNSTGILADVPLEVITSISLYLPTKDYLNARLALRSFHSVFYRKSVGSQQIGLQCRRSRNYFWCFESPLLEVDLQAPP